MGLYKNGIEYKNVKNGAVFEVLDYGEVATEEEVKLYILNMAPANITANGDDLIITFEPFPQKYVNYMRQRQYRGRRQQVYWQLVRYVGKRIRRKSDLIGSQSLSADNKRMDINNDLYHWTFPTRHLYDHGTMKPYYFNLTAKDAALGRIVWSGGNIVINNFKNRPFGVYTKTFPKEIAIIIGLGKKGMENTFSSPLIYKKSVSYKYDSVLPVADLINMTNLNLSFGGNDYIVTFDNVPDKLREYAEKNYHNKDRELFLQAFDYRGGTKPKVKRGPLGERKPSVNPAKPRDYIVHIGANELENGVVVSHIVPSNHNFRPRYKYEEETFHNVSFALVLANKGMNEGFHTFKESNKINIL